jgi:hypothetical protein
VLIGIGLPMTSASSVVVGGVAVSASRAGTLQTNLVVVEPTAPVDIRPIQARGDVTMLQPVSELCQGCLVAVNGDYFDLHTHQPDGGVIIDGTVVRSPNNWQRQFTIKPDGHPAAGLMQFTGKLTTSDAKTLPVSVNVDHTPDQLVLYDGHFAGHTPGDPAAFEVIMFGDPAGLALSRPLQMKIADLHGPGTPIPAGQVVLSGTGAAANQVRDLWNTFKAGKIKAEAQLSLTTDPPARHSLGANYVILQGGQVQPIGENDTFVNGPEPRTLAGWDPGGRTYFMTIGGTRRGHRTGVSLAQAAAMIKARGATDAINLDDGGSSTFVADGRVTNNPSDGPDRPVDNAWVVMARPGVLAQLAAAAAAARAVVPVRVVAPPPPPVAPPKPPVTTTTTVAPTTTTTTAPAPPPTEPPTTIPEITAPPTTVAAALAIDTPATPSDGAGWALAMKLAALLGLALVVGFGVSSLFRRT